MLILLVEVVGWAYVPWGGHKSGVHAGLGGVR